MSSNITIYIIIYLPIKYCTGTSQVFLLPNFGQNKESTIGAHNNFKLNGHVEKLNSA